MQLKLGWEKYHNERLQYSNIVNISTLRIINNFQWKQVIYLRFYHIVFGELFGVVYCRCCTVDSFFLTTISPSVLSSIYCTSGMCIFHWAVKLLKLLFSRGNVLDYGLFKELLNTHIMLLLLRSFLTLSLWLIYIRNVGRWNF